MLALIGVASQAFGAERFGTYLELKGGIYSPSATFNVSDNLNTFKCTDA